MINISKCTQCGGNIEIDSTKKEGKCPYCNAIYINESKNETKKPAEKPVPAKKKIKPGPIIAICIIFLIQVAFVIGFIVEGKAPLDEILLYKVDTVILDDGRMENTYYIEWKVLNDNKIGPLTWVKIGMPNSNFEVKNFGQDVVKAYPFSESSSVKEWVRCNLKYVYSAGQIAKIEFTVIQSDMLCYDSDEYFYEFIPGWFDEIEVKSYEFNWTKDDRLSSSNADEEIANTLTWKGSLERSGHRVINVKYNSASFSEDQTVQYRAFVKPASSGDSFNPGWTVILIFGAFFLIFIQIGIIVGIGSYRRGRGFILFGGHYHGGGRSGGGSSGGGSSCACACAGCACACACAGGGRAGCSLKDFYSTTDTKEKLEEISS